MQSIVKIGKETTVRCYFQASLVLAALTGFKLQGFAGLTPAARLIIVKHRRLSL
jgi:hypothetical protein